MLHSQILGAGKPFVVLHGFLGMSDNWKTLGNRFSESGYEVHLVDQRNHGRSFHDDSFSYALMTEDLKAYCDANNLDDIVLLGHSMGGKTAMEFATQYPERVSKLVVADIAPKAYPQHHQDILKALSSLDFDKIKSRKDAEETLAEYIPIKSVRLFLMKNLYRKTKDTFALRINLPVLIETIEEVGKGLDDNRHYAGEVLFLRGDKSGYILPEDEGLIKHYFPNAKIETIEGAGHWLHAENPNLFFDLTMAFLQGEK